MKEQGKEFEEVKVADLLKNLDLKVTAGKIGLDRQVKGGYCGDLLSDVMANAPIGCIWLTVQGHQNIVAVALLREMAAIVVVSGNIPDQETQQKADQEGIPLLLWPDSAYELAGCLHDMGIRGAVDGEE